MCAAFVVDSAKRIFRQPLAPVRLPSVCGKGRENPANRTLRLGCIASEELCQQIRHHFRKPNLRFARKFLVHNVLGRIFGTRSWAGQASGAASNKIVPGSKFRLITRCRFVSVAATAMALFAKLNPASARRRFVFTASSTDARVPSIPPGLVRIFQKLMRPPSAEGWSDNYELSPAVSTASPSIVAASILSPNFTSRRFA